MITSIRVIIVAAGIIYGIFFVIFVASNVGLETGVYLAGKYGIMRAGRIRGMDSGRSITSFSIAGSALFQNK